uniref:Uncharacterized protein n=1 Tax=Ixodes ricinus TaxID=34613 RepID=A0A6B0UT87_IXORI
MRLLRASSTRLRRRKTMQSMFLILCGRASLPKGRAHRKRCLLPSASCCRRVRPTCLAQRSLWMQPAGCTLDTCSKFQSTTGGQNMTAASTMKPKCCLRRLSPSSTHEAQPDEKQQECQLGGWVLMAVPFITACSLRHQA